MQNSRRRLIRHDTLLRLPGLLAGLVETQFPNVRMGLAVRLEGVMNTTVLVAVGTRASA